MTDRNANPPEALDAVLDRALASYIRSAPRSGLDERVRARLAAASDPSSRRLLFSAPWAWAAAATLAAAGVLLAVVLRPHSPAVPKNLAGIPHLPALPPVTRPAGVHPAGEHTLAPLHRTAAARLVRDSAPPQPTQQQLIAQLLANGPEAVASLARVAEQQDKPIEIKPLPADPLVIEPIDIPPLDDNSAEPGGS